MTPIVIFGAGGMGRETHELIEDLVAAGSPLEILGFLDDDSDTHGERVQGIPVLGDVAWLTDHSGTLVALGVGAPAAKLKVAQRVHHAGGTLFTLIHPSAMIGRRVEIGQGSVVCAGAILTTNVSVGSFVTVNVGATIMHDSVIRDFCTLGPGARVSGNVAIGSGTDCGTGATVIQGVTIGEWSIIGAGASVVRDLPSNATSVGVPARVIKEREPGWHL